MFMLPRGVGNRHNVPLTSAAWELPRKIERLIYTGGRQIFLGAIPLQNNMPALAQAFTAGGAAIGKIEASGMAPADRSAAIDTLVDDFSNLMAEASIPIGLADDRHLVTIAGSRSGKGTSAIIPNLAIYPGSIICPDPKGENATATAARRGRGDAYCEGLGQDVFVLDPFETAAGVPDELRASFNALALLDPTDPMVVDDAALMAQGLIVSIDHKDAHWDESAQNFLKALILHLKTTLNNPSLLDVRQFLMNGDAAGFKAFKDKIAEIEADLNTRAEEIDEEEFKAITAKLERMNGLLHARGNAFQWLLHRMAKNEACNGVIAGAALMLDMCGENERGSILSTAKRNTAFLDTLGPRFHQVLKGEGRTFSPEIFRSEKGATLYLCLPAERMGTHGRWIRLMIAVMLERMYRPRPDPAAPAMKYPILFLLEEFFTLGHMAVIEKAAGYAAGFGVKLWAILQDLQQLKALYPNSWQTFLANAGAIQVFGVSDPETTEYISKALGDVMTYQTTLSDNTSESTNESRRPLAAGLMGAFQTKNPYFGIASMGAALIDEPATQKGASRSANYSQQIQITPLLRPDEIAMVFARETGAQLIMIKGRLPIWCLRAEYHSWRWFQGRYTPLDRSSMPTAADPSFGVYDHNAFESAATNFIRRCGS